MTSLSKPLAAHRILMFVDDVYEDLELWYPKLRMIEAGAHVTVAGPEAQRVYHGKHSYPCRSDAAICDMEAADFQGVVIPADSCPTNCAAISACSNWCGRCAQTGKLVAAICHAGWIPISAGVYRGVRVTGSLGIKDDLVNAGALLGRLVGGGRSSLRLQPQAGRPSRFLRGHYRCAWPIDGEVKVQRRFGRPPHFRGPLGAAMVVRRAMDRRFAD